MWLCFSEPRHRDHPGATDNPSGNLASSRPGIYDGPTLLEAVLKRLRGGEWFDFKGLGQPEEKRTWSPVGRPKYQRNGMRYASDLTVEGLALIEPQLPPANTRGRRPQRLRCR